MMIVDIHAHAAGIYGSVDSIKNTAAKYGIETIVLCTGPKNNRDIQPPCMPSFKQKPDSIFLLNRMNRFAYRHFIKDAGDGNQFVFKLSSLLPELVVPFLWVNPLDASAMDTLEDTIRARRPKGIKLHQAWNPFKIDSKEFHKLVDLSCCYDLPIFIHLYSRKDVFKLIHFIQQNPNAVFIIGHLAGADFFRESGVNLGHIYFDTSSSDRIQSEDIRRAIDHFGYEHIVFGTDTPYVGIDKQIDKIEHLSLPDRIQEHIFCLNAKRILSI